MMGFTAKAIAKAQKLSIADPFCAALNEYLVKRGLLFWDDERALFWVNHPEIGPQVAVWMMPVAERFRPAKPIQEA